MKITDASAGDLVEIACNSWAGLSWHRVRVGAQRLDVKRPHVRATWEDERFARHYRGQHLRLPLDIRVRALPVSDRLAVNPGADSAARKLTQRGDS